MEALTIPKRKVFMYTANVDNNYTSLQDSIVLPTNVRRIVSICPNMVNGMGFLSIYVENTNDQLLNSVKVEDDNVHFNKKNIPLFCYPERSNLNYNLRLVNSDVSKPCKLKVFITYEL